MTSEKGSVRDPKIQRLPTKQQCYHNSFPNILSHVRYLTKNFCSCHIDIVYSNYFYINNAHSVQINGEVNTNIAFVRNL